MNLTQEQTNNIHTILSALPKFGITNKFMKAGILGTVYKECDFIPQAENLNYSLENIKRVWSRIPDDVAQGLVHNAVALGNYKYGGKYGNSLTEGYKFRGGFFNQVTYKAEYEKFGTIIGVDLVTDPEKYRTDPSVSADVLGAFMSTELIAGMKAKSFTKFNVDAVDSIIDVTTGLKVAIQINAGRGTNFQNAVIQEGYNKAMTVISSLLDLVQ